MSLEFTPTTIFVSVLGLLHGYFFFTLTIFLAGPLSDLASASTKLGMSDVSRHVTYGMAIAFLITMFFSLPLIWLLLFAAGNLQTFKEYFRPWTLFWFVGIILYCVVIRAGRPREQRT